MLESNTQLFAQLGQFVFIFVILILWSSVWKALALWKSARASSIAWFVVFMFVNTLGILEILYLFVITKPSASVAPEIKA